MRDQDTQAKQRFPANSARWCGLSILVAAAATAVSVPTRLMADADQPTLLQSLHAIAERSVLYGAGGLARTVSGLALVAATFYLRRVSATWRLRSVDGGALLLAASGLATAVSGACAVALAAMVPSPPFDSVEVAASMQLLADLRRIAGSSGFTLAGLALLALAPAQWGMTGMRTVAVVGFLIGVMMLFIWVDAAALTHRVSGVAFLVWLIAAGTWLAAGRLKPPASVAEDTDLQTPS